jgi:hypothetical protein
MSTSIVTKRASAILAWIWLGGFCLCLAVPCLLLLRHAIEWENFSASLETISGLYVPYLGVILSYYFVSAGKSKSYRRKEMTPFAIAAVVSLVWNCVIFGFFGSIFLGTFQIEDALKISAKAGAALCWLVAPAIGYFFGKPASQDAGS